MKGWVGQVGWPVADGLPTLVVTHQLQVERRTGKVRQSETGVLPLRHATNCYIQLATWLLYLYATLLLPNFHVHRHTEVTPVVTHISSAWRPAPLCTRYMNRLNPGNNGAVRNVPLPPLGPTRRSGIYQCESPAQIHGQSDHGRPHTGANGVSWPSWKNGWEIKKRKYATKTSFLNTGGGKGRVREGRCADHIFIQTYFGMHHFVAKFSKFSSPRAARGHWLPLTKIPRTPLTPAVDGNGNVMPCKRRRNGFYKFTVWKLSTL